MDIDPREWHPPHQLERIEIRIELNEGGVRVSTMQGRSCGKRTALWTVAYGQNQGGSVLDFVERISWLLQGALIDKPNSQPSMERSMATTKGYEDVALPW